MRRVSAAVVFAVLALAPSARSQSTDLKPGAFDFGKMWTFEYAPAEYFSSTYGFDASPNGLVVTNHHCARGAVSAVTREGEHLLDDERPIPNTYADQLIAAEARQDAIDRVQKRLQAQHAGSDEIRVQVVPLYNGGRYSAYVF